MKFKYILISLLFVSLFACKKGDSFDVSKVTTFATFEFEPTVILAKGSSYNPTVVAKEGEKSIPTNQIGTVDVNSVGVYEIVFSATNTEGYDGTATQTVIVYDPAAPDIDLSGNYSSSIVRTEADGSTPRNRSAETNITKIANGVFYVDCLLGGFYSIAGGIGPTASMTGYISLESDLTITNLQSFVPYWEDGLEDFQNGSYDEGAGTLYWEAYYAAGDIFHVTLN